MTTPNDDSRPLRVVLAGGGTAGHISPMLAIARALGRQDPSTVCTMVGTASGMETRLVPQAGYELDFVERVPMPRRPSMDVVRFPGRFQASVRQAGEILRRRGADVLVGVGGYVSTPMYLAASRAGVPVVVHEANARPGLANRVGALRAARVGTALPDTRLPKAQWVGMPMRPEISGLDRAAARDAARAELGLDPERTTVVVTGGSSGALNVNRTVRESLDDLLGAGLQVFHLTGRGKEFTDEAGQRVTRPGYVQREYLDGMEKAYAAADLIVARSGAGTVCEIAAVGLPAVFVPLPVGNGEQALNSRPVVDAGGALLVRDETFRADWVRRELIPLAADPQRLAAMGEAAARLGVRDADVRTADLVREAAREGARR